MRSRHLILYDDSCSICRKAVHKILKKDAKAIFAFAPLWGDTAKGTLKDDFQRLFNLKTIVLIENFLGDTPKVFIYSKAIFQIYWLLGGRFRTIGCLSFLFPFTNLLYQLVAKHRHQLNLHEEDVDFKPYKDRFLP